MNQESMDYKCIMNLNQWAMNVNEDMNNMNEIRPRTKWIIKQIGMVNK